MPANLPPGPGQQLPPTTQGPIDRVPCPACGRHNDFRHLKDENLLDTAEEYACEVRDANGNNVGCGRLMQVQAMQQIMLVVVRPSIKTPSGPRGPALPPGQGVLRVRRLLGRR